MCFSVYECGRVCLCGRVCVCVRCGYVWVCVCCDETVNLNVISDRPSVCPLAMAEEAQNMPTVMEPPRHTHTHLSNPH